jgi:hypothetical protein
LRLTTTTLGFSRKEMLLISLTYFRVPGIREWDACRRHLPSIRAHLATIVAAAL